MLASADGGVHVVGAAAIVMAGIVGFLLPAVRCLLPLVLPFLIVPDLLFFGRGGF